MVAYFYARRAEWIAAWRAVPRRCGRLALVRARREAQMSRRKRWKKWGVLFSGDKMSLPDQLKLAAGAEAAGAESLWSAELWRDSFVPLAAMATVARKARLGTGVAHFARTPLLTELAAASMAELSGDRFVLGLGT